MTLVTTLWYELSRRKDALFQGPLIWYTRSSGEEQGRRGAVLRPHCAPEVSAERVIAEGGDLSLKALDEFAF